MYTLHIKGMPTPRPRKGKWGIYSPTPYKKYLEELSNCIRGLGVPDQDYSGIMVRFFFEYPKSTPKKKQIDLEPHRSKFDCDNLVKGLLDALTYAEVLRDDSQISSVCVSKFYTLEENRIEFDLLTNRDDRV